MPNPALALMHDLITSDTGDYDFSEHWDMIELIDLYEIPVHEFVDYADLHGRYDWDNWNVKFWDIKADLAVEIASRACGLIRKYHEELNNENRG